MYPASKTVIGNKFVKLSQFGSQIKISKLLISVFLGFKRSVKERFLHFSLSLSFLLVVVVVVMGKAAVVCAAVACAVATLYVRHRMRSSGKWATTMAILKEFEEKCETPISKLRKVADAMAVEMHVGLASEGGSKLKMLISYVDNLFTVV
ncbi:hexokinase-1-like [Tripterygium wilfordii]|uniref:hexokinase-1-like n=1 Tax=Tripterygium wilfordii TaxID=458696 RepID=UPI0018F81079|nr:hexokinase-1-like [Tripterygium wilfordii]